MKAPRGIKYLRFCMACKKKYFERNYMVPNHLCDDCKKKQFKLARNRIGV